MQGKYCAVQQECLKCELEGQFIFLISKHVSYCRLLCSGRLDLFWLCHSVLFILNKTSYLSSGYVLLAHFLQFVSRCPRDNFFCWQNPRPIFAKHVFVNQFKKSSEVANPHPSTDSFLDLRKMATKVLKASTFRRT